MCLFKIVTIVFPEKIYTFEIRRFFALLKMTAICHPERSEGSSDLSNWQIFYGITIGKKVTSYSIYDRYQINLLTLIPYYYYDIFDKKVSVVG